MRKNGMTEERAERRLELVRLEEIIRDRVRGERTPEEARNEAMIARIGATERHGRSRRILHHVFQGVRVSRAAALNARRT